MTVDQVNTEVADFVQGAWVAHRAVDVQSTVGENVTEFLPNNEAKIRFSSRGNLHYEICHLIIEYPSSNGCIEECTKEGVCDAYKFLKMQQNDVNMYTSGDRDWFAKINRFKEQEIQAIVSTSGDKPHDIINGIPAARILRRFDTLDKLRNQLVLGISAEDITDPDFELPEVLRYCWPLWKAMDGKTEDEKRPIKQQIETKLSGVLGHNMWGRA